MTATAYVLINAELGNEEKVLAALKEIEGVVEANMVYGVYDVIAKIETTDLKALKDLISWKVRRLDHVRSTLTMIVMDNE